MGLHGAFANSDGVFHEEVASPAPVMASLPRLRKPLAHISERVLISGVASRPELNGTVVSVERYDHAKHRFGVLIDGSEMGLKPASLLRVDVSREELRLWLGDEQLDEHTDAVARVELATALAGGQASLLAALKAGGVRSLGVRLRLASLLLERLPLSYERDAQAPAEAAPAAPAAAPAVASDAPMANGETCEAGGGGGVLATVDPRFKKLSPMAGEAAEVLGIPRDATWDQALHMLAPQMEGVTAEQMKAALEELTIGMSDDFEDWT